MDRQIMQPEVPELFPNLPLGRVAMLIQRLKIAENARDFFASKTQLLSVHEFHPGSVAAGMG